MPSLDWIGKDEVVNHHREVPYRLIHCDSARSAGDPEAGNLLVQGDNLEALRALLPYYAGKIKCIYIDPPYNTGNEGWIYNDKVNGPEIRRWLGKVVGKDAEDLSRHDKWLCMMYPRLRLLRDFLTDDGVLFVSLDDHEIDHGRLLIDEIFGRQNFIVQITWDKTRKNDAKLFSAGHDYILCYARNKRRLREDGTRWREAKPGSAEILRFWREKKASGLADPNIQEELREWYSDLPRGHPSKALSRYKWVDERGPWRDRDISWPGGGGPTYEILHPITRQPCAVPDAGWRFATKEKMDEQIERGLVEFRRDHTEPPFRKAYLSRSGDAEDGEDAGSVMTSLIQKQAQVTVKHLRGLFDGRDVFPNPKDHEVIARLINYVAGPDDIILDSFAGSGTTGEAVLQLNASDGGQRRFVLVELEKSTAFEITGPRIQKVIEGYSVGADTSTFVKGTGGGFRFCRLGSPLFDEFGDVALEVQFSDLAAHIFFSETGVPIPQRATGELLGAHQGRAVYLLFDAAHAQAPREAAGNVLTPDRLATLPPPPSGFDGVRVVYAEGCTVSADRLKAQGVRFKQIPYQVEGA